MILINGCHENTEVLLMNYKKRLIIPGLMIIGSMLFAGCQGGMKEAAVQPERATRALAIDSDFESGMGIWYYSAWQATCNVEITTEESRSGSQCVHISNVLPDYSNWGINPVGGISHNYVTLDGNITYILSMWTKSGPRHLDYGVLTACLDWMDDGTRIQREFYSDFRFSPQEWSESLYLLRPPPHSGVLTFAVTPRATPNAGDIYIDDIQVRPATAQELIDLKYKPTVWEAEIPTLISPVTGTVPSSGKAEVQEINGQWWCVRADGTATFLTGMVSGAYTNWPEYESFVTTNYGTSENYRMQDMWPRAEALGFNGFSINGAPELAQTYKGGESGLLFTQSNSDNYAAAYMTYGAGNFSNSQNSPWELHNRNGDALCALAGGTHGVADPWNSTWVTALSWFYNQRLNVEESGYPGSYKGAVFYIPAGETYFDRCEDFSWSQAASSEYITMLQNKYGDIESLKTAWNKPAYSDWSDILAEKPYPLTSDGPMSQDRRMFVRNMLSAYSDVCVDAIHTVAPNMQIASPRVHRGCAAYLNQEGLWDTFSRYDVICYNRATSWFDGYIGMAWSDYSIFMNMHEFTGKPVYSSEWNVLSSDVAHDGSDPHNVYETQADRGLAFKAYQTQYATLPFCVGSLYWNWLDDPTGVVDGTGPRNYGFVRTLPDVNGPIDSFYQDCVDIVAQTNKRILMMDPSCRTWDGSAYMGNVDPGTRLECKCTGGQSMTGLLMGMILLIWKKTRRPASTRS